MTDTTKLVVSAALRGDPSVADEVREAALDLLTGKVSLAGENKESRVRDEVVTLAEAARRLRCSERSILNYANSGKIRRIAPGGGRAIGYSALSIDALFAAV